MNHGDPERRVRFVLPTPAVVALVMLGLLAAVIILRSGRSLLIPLVLSGLLSYALAPVVAWLERGHLPRWLAVVLVMTALAAATAGAVASLRAEAVALIEDLPHAARQVREQFESSRWAGHTLDKIQEASTEIDRTSQPARPAAQAAPQASLRRRA